MGGLPLSFVILSFAQNPRICRCLCRCPFFCLSFPKGICFCLSFVILSFAQNPRRCLCPCRCLFYVRHSDSKSQNLCLCLFSPVILSFAQNLSRCLCPCPFFRLSFPKGICFCLCLFSPVILSFAQNPRRCLCFVFARHSERSSESPSFAFAFVLSCFCPDRCHRC